jgi:beta-glucanase (GH16 family)
MSDEFNSSARQFGDGFDSLWTAIDTTGLESWRNGQMAIYTPQHATTDEGKLKITTTKSPDPLVNNGISYGSAMLQTWNKFCFTGGIIEFSAQLPGAPKIPGLWPALWLFGNMGR